MRRAHTGDGQRARREVRKGNLDERPLEVLTLAPAHAPAGGILRRGPATRIIANALVCRLAPRRGGGEASARRGDVAACASTDWGPRRWGIVESVWEESGRPFTRQALPKQSFSLCMHALFSGRGSLSSSLSARAGSPSAVSARYLLQARFPGMGAKSREKARYERACRAFPRRGTIVCYLGHAPHRPHPRQSATTRRPSYTQYTPTIHHPPSRRIQTF